MGDKTAELRSVIDKLADMNTKFTECVATFYAVWSDALMDGQTPDDDALVESFRRDWHENKLKFRENDLHDWLSWMRRNDFVPRGTGPRTIPTTTPSLFENE